MGCAMPQEDQQQQLGEQQTQQQQLLQVQRKESVMAPLANNNNNISIKQEKTVAMPPQHLPHHPAGKLKGSHSALVKLLESAPIAQIRPALKQKSSDSAGNRDQNHYRKGELGTSKCPWKKSRICAEWLLKNQQETEQQQTQAVMAMPNVAANPETEPMPKGEFLPPQAQPAEDVEMTDLQGLACTCHELSQEQGQDSTDEDELAKCSCDQCSGVNTLSPAMLLGQHRTSSVSDSGCEDSDCAENKITDLCNRFNENLSKDDDVRHLPNPPSLSSSLCAHVVHIV